MYTVLAHLFARKRIVTEFIIITVLVVLLTYIYLLKEFSTPLLYGIDGPYYYIQVSSILASAQMKYLDPPLSFYIPKAYSILLGDVIAGIKVGSVIMTLLATYAILFSEVLN